MRIKKTKLYRPGMNKGLPKRLNWEHIENIPRQEGRQVVKGTSKRVVVVKSPDPRFFEQAIFILKEDLRPKGAGEASEVLREAQRVADDYVRSFTSDKKNFLNRFPPAIFAVLGAAAASLMCIAVFCFL